jgi:hypothetical protein
MLSTMFCQSMFAQHTGVHELGAATHATVSKVTLVRAASRELIDDLTPPGYDSFRSLWK